MQYKGFEQALRALDREREELWEKEKELGWAELDVPIMRGWKRYFVLREDVARSKYAIFFQTLLDKINTVDYSSRKDFTTKYRKGGKKLRAVTHQRLKYLGEVNQKKISFSEKERSHFEEREIADRTGKKFIKVLVFTEPWRFSLRIRPNMITKVKVEDRDIESRVSEIDNYFDTNNFKPALAKMKGHSYGRGWWHDEELVKDRHIFKNTPFPQVLDAIKEAN
jgi:hypothetical protein